jgi:predicted nucleic acid-binding protein
MDAFDADVLIYAAVPGHRLGRRIAALLPEQRGGDVVSAVGSLFLVPELLSKPHREGRHDEVATLADILSRLELRPLDDATAALAVALCSSYGIRAADAVHLATAVQFGADRFITNNQRDFQRSITEISVTYPADLPDPTA